MITVEEARDRILAEISPLGVERIPLDAALGRVLAEPIVAPFDVPPRDNTAMDGYAVRAADVAGAGESSPITLRVVETISAGKVPKKRVGEGEAARIMTGAEVPEGADAIVVVEKTTSDGESVRIFTASPIGAHIRRRGEDVVAGATILEPRAELGAGEIGLLASIGRGHVRVSRRPTVAILSTGDEIVEIDDQPARGQIFNSNTFSLAALTRECGASPVVLPVVGDSLDATESALRDAAACDAVVTSGGVSVGDFDFVKAALDALGAETKFWRIAMKPGKPVVFARLLEKPFFGLPGNPVSAMVAFHLFVRPALRKAMHVADAALDRPVVRARLANGVRASGVRRTYLRALVEVTADGLVATTKPAQGSGVLSSMVAANGLVVAYEGTREIAAGETVDVQLIGELR